MATKRSHRLNDAFDQAEDDFGDKSTEFLAAIAADRCGVEPHEVIDAIVDVAGECSGPVPFRYSRGRY